MIVGVIDSGLGGLSVVKEVKRALRGVPIVYLGDNARVPYGARSDKIIRRFALQLSSFLEDQGITALVVACHTISAVALDAIKAQLTVPIVDVVSPTISYVQKSGFRKMLVLGTSATVRSNIYRRNLKPLGVEIEQIEAPLLVSLAEYGPFAKGLIIKGLKHYLKGKQTPEALVLACTHFPIFEQEIQTLFPEAQIINPAVPAAQLLRAKIKQFSKNGSLTKDKFYFTDMPPSLPEVAERFLGQPLESYSLVELENS